jgi:molybdate transport system regulatory protein
LLLDAMNRLFHSPVIATATGGQQGGGASLTAVGEQVLSTYRDVESAAAEAGRAGLKILSALLDERPKPVAKAPRRPAKRAARKSA